MKEIADAKKANAAKRRRESNSKKRGPLKPSSIKSGVKKVVSKARITPASRKKPANTPSKQAASSSEKAPTSSKRGANIKLPTIKPSKSKAKTTVRVRKPAQSQTEKASPAKSRSRVTETKATKTVPVSKKSPTGKPLPKPKDVLNDVQKPTNKGTTARQSPIAKAATRTSGRSPRAKKQ